NAAIDHHRQRGHALAQAIDPRIVERRNGAVFLGAEALQPSLARMDIKGIDAGFSHTVGEAVEAFFRVLIVNADTAFDRHRTIGCVAHGAYALSDKLRLGHEAGAK